MSDLLERRYEGFNGDAEFFASSNYPGIARQLAQHVVDLKREVVRLREAGKVELTEQERIDVEYIRRVASSSALLAIIDRLCPPKAPPTNEELADMLDNASLNDVRVVAAALRARGDK